MVFPTQTAVAAGVLALIFMALTLWVSAARMQYRVLHGDGGNEVLHRRIRAHANFAEYVPLILLLVGLLEAAGGNPANVRSLLVVLVVARIAHPIGMTTREGSIGQYVLRGGGAGATWAVMVIAALLLLLRVWV
jgi:uncharacterized membrane protein YecN with MAPEG domain